jgi:hypothetical protein
MAAAVVGAVVVGLLAQNRVEPRHAYAAAEPGNASPHLLDADEPAGAGDAESLRGRVLEVIEVAQYTYLRLSAAQGELWAAVSKAPVEVGSQVTVVDANRMENFESATLKRTFDVIYFGSLATPGAAASDELPPGHPRIGGQSAPLAALAAAAPAPSVEVARASGKGAHTIGELYAQRSQLAGQVVRVRGQVIKVTPAVLGKTYLRLRDGSGVTPEQRELVVTSQLLARVGDVSTFEGTLQTDVDVGIGLVYPVLLSDAKRIEEPDPAPAAH